jgi:hypothetical protein
MPVEERSRSGTRGGVTIQTVEGEDGDGGPLLSEKAVRERSLARVRKPQRQGRIVLEGATRAGEVGDLLLNVVVTLVLTSRVTALRSLP